MAKKYKKVSYEIDLVQVFERAMADRPQSVRSKLRGLMSSRLFKQKYGEKVIDRIGFRTEKKGIDKDNKPFLAPYSQMYQKSLEFEVYKKSPNNVNLKLTGEMLASMKLGKSGTRKIKVIMADDFNNAKAHGHVNGIERRVDQKAKVKVKNGKRIAPQKKKIKRDFLGLPKDEESKLLKETIREFSDESIVNLINFQNETLDFNIETATAAAGVETAEAPISIEAASIVDTVTDGVDFNAE